MIFDQLSQSRIYENMNQRMAAAFDYIKDNDLSKFKDGVYELDGKNLFAIISTYNTKPRTEVKWECHRKYIDIQYIASGVELIGYAPIDTMEVNVEYIQEKDVAFMQGDGNFIIVPQGHFTVFFPQDVHSPGLSVVGSVEVKKVVIKILVE